MVVASGRSQRQVHALVDIISKEVKEHLNVNIAIEGKSKSDWAVLDFGDIIVHVFHPEARDFYKIEELWQD
ncbi:MAG: Ribosomal silencing factor RsfS [Alphaproteobacteria bacterium ADurb.Bin438]|nr:MAG: Ribosomal silencing factor RsfS [Alphaproteobacteria bacterium ADurb.Bin438]